MTDEELHAADGATGNNHSGDSHEDAGVGTPETDATQPDHDGQDDAGITREVEDAAERSFSAIGFDDAAPSDIRLTNRERTDLEDHLPRGDAAASDQRSEESAEADIIAAGDESLDDGGIEEGSDPDGDGATVALESDEHTPAIDGEDRSEEATPVADGAEAAPAAKKTTRGRSRRGKQATKVAEESAPAPQPQTTPTPAPAKRTIRQVRSSEPMLILVNDTPAEECRIAVLESKKLQSYFAERASTATNVGNIYKGRVINIEPAIQAAFVDFGTGANGFLHISDLHPKYFPGNERSERTERVGRKIPRRDRPLIQEALRRGQEIVVQVIKEGLGSKGPTVTSYISIPGRLLVMMPDMDRVGVSRKVEDEDQRRQMRKILDSLDLPDGFGFILRTAGFDRTKTELQRDAAYLTRLWKAMEKRMDRTGAPCGLYTESDLLIRTLRDFADPAIEAIVVDSSSAYERAKLFLEIVAPRSAPKILFWDRPYPLFEAFSVERQVDEIHARAVPLRSGGELVFDQAEALVAIDVNSGKSRSARDSETNAFNTNIEAVNEVCRQLRLRDLGGLIVMDFIDMRSYQNRRAVEDKLREELKRDRAKTTFLPISDFGMIEMTRQRMRPSLRKTHYFDCPHCTGHGELRLPDTVAAEALRRIALLFAHDRVRRVELVCSARVATELLSTKRRAMHDLEMRFGKHIDVRISEAFSIDRTEVYAADDRNSDIEIDRLPALPVPVLDDLPREPVEAADQDGDGDESVLRRRRRRRNPAPADATAIALAGGFDDLPEVDDTEAPILDELEDDEPESAGNEAPAPRGSQSSQQRNGNRSLAIGANAPRSEGRGRGRNQRRRRRKSVSFATLATELRTDRATMLTRLREAVPPLDLTDLNDDSTELSGDNAAFLRNTMRPEPAPRAPRTPDTDDRHGRRRRRRSRGNLMNLPAPDGPVPAMAVADECGVGLGELLDHLRCSLDEATAATITDDIADFTPELVLQARFLHSPRWATDSGGGDATPSDSDGGGSSAADSDGGTDGVSDAKSSGGDAPQGDRSDRSDGAGGGRSRNRRRGRRGRGRSHEGESSHGDHSNGSNANRGSTPQQPQPTSTSAPAPVVPPPSSTPASAPSAGGAVPAPPAPARRSLYGSVIRKLGLGRSSSAKNRDE
ncbi:MAG: Rne/Rng family ribonuclease [Phycisphaerales bacterium]|nr:Rne/Rng family ribonuclease [Phycisphaerales bacterium]